MSMSFLAATAAALTIFNQAAPAQCPAPVVPTPMTTEVPTLPERPDCITAEGENNCRGNRADAYIAAVEQYNTAAPLWQAEYRAYVQSLRDYAQAANTYAQCENQRVVPAHLRQPAAQTAAPATE